MISFLKIFLKVVMRIQTLECRISFFTFNFINQLIEIKINFLVKTFRGFLQ